jgi:EAL domain-containing protein (putative c-di-GMP-specific phosphodiesterase class I)
VSESRVAGGFSPDPAAEIVALSARLLRLQSRLGGEDAVHPSASNARQAAVRSGMEVLQGLTVSLIDEIRQAAARDAFHYVYQPIVSLVTGAIESHEALIRWRRGEESVGPELFLPLAEETRLIAPIQQRLLDQLALVQTRLPSTVTVAINWSPVQLAQQNAVSALIDRARELRIDPRRVVIEITERSAMADPELTLASVRRLKEVGFGIALDDFGTGYCSFAYLSLLPVDIVKIDCSLIAAAEHSTRATTILDGVVDIAHRLGHRVVAEGVESAQQVRAARRLGCDLAQGRALGLPTHEPTAQAGVSLPA